MYIQDGNLYVRKTNETTAQSLGSVKGDKGDKGDTGATGAQGEQGIAGNDGTNGVDGKSAYELYKETYPDYTGTMEEWIESLKGEDGADGRGIESTEVIDGYLWITYTDGMTENAGKVSENYSSEGTLGSAFKFELLDDGTYGVKAGANSVLYSKLIIPDTYNGIAVTQILKSGFADLDYLEQVVIPSSITTINSDAFESCGALNSVDIPESVTTINSEAFYCCESLTSVTIPKNVTYIGAYAFKINALKNVYFEDITTWKKHYPHSSYGSPITYTSAQVSDSEYMAQQLKSSYAYSTSNNGVTSTAYLGWIFKKT